MTKESFVVHEREKGEEERKKSPPYKRVNRERKKRGGDLERKESPPPSYACTCRRERGEERIFSSLRAH